jgi:hypothetical protein
MMVDVSCDPVQLPKSGFWLLPTVILWPWPRHSSGFRPRDKLLGPQLISMHSQVTVNTYTLRWTLPIQLNIKKRKKTNTQVPNHDLSPRICMCTTTNPFSASRGKWQQMPRCYTPRVPGTRSTSKMVNYICSVASSIVRMAYTLWSIYIKALHLRHKTEHLYSKANVYTI